MESVHFDVTLTLVGPVLTQSSTAAKVGIDAAAARQDGVCYLPFSLIKGRLRQSWDELGLAEGDELFGSRRGGWDATRGRLRFRDFVQLDPRAAHDASAAAVRHRIRIDAGTGAADDGALQFIESPFAPGERVRFGGRIDGYADDAETLRAEIEEAFRWTPSFGAERTIGFGRVADVAVKLVSESTSRTPSSATTPSGSTLFEVMIEPKEPFCLARQRVDENLFTSDEVIPGSVLRGIAASTLNGLLGRPSSAEITAASCDGRWAELAAYFNGIRFTHAFPSENGTLPHAVPLSTVYAAEQLWDVALTEGPVLIGGEAPQFEPDWKGKVRDDVRRELGWPQVRKQVRVRTAIDRKSRRAADEQLFAYEMIEPRNLVWRGTLDLSSVPAEVRGHVQAQLDELFATEPAALGKTKARVKVTFAPRPAADKIDLDLTPWVITLQTPALLCDPALLDEASGRDELFAAYANAFDKMSDHKLRLVRFFAAQSLAGGYLLHRFQRDKEYMPFLLTDAGSVFVLEAAGEPGEARAVVESWASKTLPLPSWAQKRYGDEWKTNPFLPCDGFGEIAVNMPRHRTSRAGSEPLVAWPAPNMKADAREWKPRGTAVHREAVPEKEERLPFKRRWRITGRLTTTSEFHLGCGATVPRPEMTRREGDKTVAIEIAAVAVDGAGRAYIPGSSLKGALRSWLTRRNAGEAQIEALFGSTIDPESKKVHVAGTAEVHDSFVAEAPADMEHVPHWHPLRATGVIANVAIDRWTRTAEDRKLFHREFVPGGVSFAVTITGDGLSEDEVALLLFALRSFGGGHDPVTLGSETGSGWGRFSWTFEQVEVLDDLKSWRSAKRLAYSGFGQFDVKRLDRPNRRIVESVRRDGRTTIGIALKFDGAFLVNEPSLTKQSKDEQSDLPNHAPRVDTRGVVVLPVSSFRGALRAQAERIARTMGQPACHSTSPEDVCKELDNLCVTCRLFGATGRASAIEFAPFRTLCAGIEYKQELLAVDRFTGGAAGGAKFNAVVRWAPKFECRATINRDRADDDALRLLALTLRDLAEGDITLGFGASKGYGTCRATVVWPDAPIAIHPPAPPHLDDSAVAPAGPRVTLPLSDNPGGDAFHNPYHFVPATATRQDDVSVEDFRARKHLHLGHDVYAEGTFSGRMICRLTTVTPMVIGASQTKREAENQTTIVHPFVEPGTTPQLAGEPAEGTPAIPGTSLRGLLSSIAEAASNSALRVLAEEHYSYRASMQESLQAIGMVVGAGKSRRLRPLALPALRCHANAGGTFTAVIPPHYRTMFPQPLLKKFVNGYHPTGAPPQVHLRRGSFLETTRPESYSADHRRQYWWAVEPDVESNNGTITVRNARVRNQWLLGYDANDSDPIRTPTPPANYTRGILRVLGVDGREKEMPTTKKHEIFIPYTAAMEKAATFEAIEAIEDFERLAAQRTAADAATPFHVRGSHRNADGAMDKPIELREGDLVFFEPARDGTKVQRVATSSIWRHGVKASKHDFFRNVSPELLPFNDDRKMITLAEQLFGFVNTTDERGSAPKGSLRGLASRVRISSARLQQPCAEPFLAPQTLRILASPKPPSPAFYFRPNAGGAGYIAKKDLNGAEHRPQGRKMYLHHARWNAQQPPWATEDPGDNAKQKSYVRPVRQGCMFHFHVDFDNLTARELALLCYSVRPSDTFLHKIGMGRSVGLGSVQVDPVGLFFIDRRKRPESAERYHSIAAGTDAAALPAEYDRERNAAQTATKTLSFAELREQFRATMDEDIRAALEILGDPEKVTAPVHTPQIAGRDTEKETFRWFVENDDTFHDALDPLGRHATVMPLLSRSGARARPHAERAANIVRNVPPPTPTSTLRIRREEEHNGTFSGGRTKKGDLIFTLDDDPRITIVVATNTAPTDIEKGTRACVKITAESSPYRAIWVQKI